MHETNFPYEVSMKRLLLFFFIISSTLSAQLIEENFDYSIGSLIVVTANWTESPSGTDVNVVSGNLSYTNYPSSGIGNQIYLDASGGTANRGGVIRSFTAVSSGTIYMSFLMNVNSTTDMDISTSNGDYLANWQSSGNTLKSLILVRQGSNTSKFSIGMRKTTAGSITWYSPELDINTTYLIVMSYTFTSGSDNDPIKFWINPSLSGSEPSADITISSGADNTDIGIIQFRQNAKSGDIYVDGVRVAISWSQAPLPVELTSFTRDIVGKKVKLFWQTATEVNNNGFEVQRLTVSNQLLANSQELNANGWSKIGFVEGHGNSNSPKNYSFTDEPFGGKEFKYRLKQIDFDGTFEYSDELAAVFEDVTSFALEQNYPNPFNPVTNISYTIPQRSNVKLRVYNMLAQLEAELVNESQEAGHYQVIFNGSNLPSGAYFYKLEAGKFVEVRKLLLVK